MKVSSTMVNIGLFLFENKVCLVLMKSRLIRFCSRLVEPLIQSCRLKATKSTMLFPAIRSL
jgi:hypothetical protein